MSNAVPVAVAVQCCTVPTGGIPTLPETQDEDERRPDTCVWWNRDESSREAGIAGCENKREWEKSSKSKG